MRSPIWSRFPDAPANRPWAEVFSKRLEPEFQEQGRDPAAVLDYVAATVDRPGFATTSPRFMAYIPGGGLFPFGAGRPDRGRVEQIFRLRLGEPRARCGWKTPPPGGCPMSSAIPRAPPAPSPPAGASPIWRRSSPLATPWIRTAGERSTRSRFAHHCVDKALHIAGRGSAPRRAIGTDPAISDVARGPRGGASGRSPPLESGPGSSSPRRGRWTPEPWIRFPRSPGCAAATVPGSTSTGPMAASSPCARKGGRG